jgi:hypothetical protein
MEPLTIPHPMYVWYAYHYHIEAFGLYENVLRNEALMSRSLINIGESTTLIRVRIKTQPWHLT